MIPVLPSTLRARPKVSRFGRPADAAPCLASATLGRPAQQDVLCLHIQVAHVVGVRVRQTTADPMHEPQELKAGLGVALDPLAEWRLGAAPYMICLSVPRATAQQNGSRMMHTA